MKSYHAYFKIFPILRIIIIRECPLDPFLIIACVFLTYNYIQARL